MPARFPMTNATAWRTGDLRLLVHRIYETLYGHEYYRRLPNVVTVAPTKPGTYKSWTRDADWHTVGRPNRRLHMKVPDVELDLTVLALNVARTLDTEQTDPEGGLRDRLAFIRRFEWTKTFEVRRRVRR